MRCNTEQSHSTVNTNTCTTSPPQVKIYFKSSKKLLHVSVFDHLQGVAMSSLKSLLLLTTVGCFYAKSGDVAACRVVLEERLSVRVLASDVEVVHVLVLTIE